MIDKAIEAGTLFDWITPLWTFVQDWRNRPSCGYSVPVDGGWSISEVRNLLRSKGVKAWGWAIVDGVILFRTRQAQAGHAQYWLERNGVPYSGGMRRQTRRTRQRRQGDGVLSTIAKWFE